MLGVVKVVNEWDTLEELLKTRKSISRYGDGEYKGALHRKLKMQDPNAHLARRLKDILKVEYPNCLVAIPNIYDGIKAPTGTKAHSFWTNVSRQSIYYPLLDPKRVYYSSFITRPDNVSDIGTHEYYEKFKQLWEGEKVVLVGGRQSNPFYKTPDFISNTQSIDYIHCPDVNAYLHRQWIMKECLKYDRSHTFLLSLGPTATVLAVDLSLRGHRALDVGHVGRFYRKYYERSNTDIPVL